MKTPKSEKRDDSKRGKQVVWSEAISELPKLCLGGFAMIVSSYANQAIPRLIGRLMDPETGKVGSQQSQSVFSNVLLIGAIGGFASFMRTMLLNQAQDSISSRLRKRAFANLMTHKGMEWFQTDQPKHTNETEQQHRAEPSKRGMTAAAIGVILREDVESVAKSATVTFASILRSTSSCVFGSYNMIILNSSLLVLSLAVAPAVGTLALLTRRTLKKTLAVQQEMSVDSANFLEERIDHISLVRTSNREEDEIQAFALLEEKWTELGRKSALANGLSMGSMFFLSSTALCGILFKGGKAVEESRMTRGELVSFATYSGLLALGTAGVMKASAEYMKGVQCASRLFDLLDDDGVQRRAEETSRDELNPSIQSIVLDNVSFAYGDSGPTQTQILQGVSFAISRGEVVVIVGRNGAGKSTLAGILSGLLLPTDGQVSLRTSRSSPGINMNKLARKDQAKLLQIVEQNAALFNDSVKYNLSYSHPTASRHELEKAMNITNCYSFVNDLENGLQYQVGKNGSRLSGGQRQRICLARALLVDPAFLVLDEPASAMDNEGETAMMEILEECRSANRALILITHRSKALKLADRIIVLKDGRVVEEGPLIELQTRTSGELCALLPELN